MSLPIDVLLVIGGWILLFPIFIFRARAHGARTGKKDRRSLIGMGLQGLGFALVFSMRRPDDTGFLPLGDWTRTAVTLVIVLLIASSVALVTASIWTLGKQWSLAARVVEDHELITRGPYAIVRHPIYAGMLGLLLATGLALVRWPELAAAVVAYGWGTSIRVASEERLLRERFGEAYDRYAARVPGFIPWVRLSGSR